MNKSTKTILLGIFFLSLLAGIVFTCFYEQDEFKKDNPAIATNISKDIYPYVVRAYNHKTFREEFGKICISINSFSQQKKIDFFMTILFHNKFDGDAWWYFCDGINKSKNEFFWDWLRKCQNTDEYKNMTEWQKQQIAFYLSAHGDYLHSIAKSVK